MKSHYIQEQMIETYQPKHWQWLSGVQLVMLPNWMLKLVETGIGIAKVSLPEFFRYAAVCGASRDISVRVGQVTPTKRSPLFTVSVPLKSLHEAKLMEGFADRIFMTSKNGIVRTAIYLGLELPKAEFGVCSQTRFTQFEYSEIKRIIENARMIIRGSDCNV